MPARWPCVPSARMVTRARMSEPGSKFASSSPSLPRPLSPVRMPTTRPPLTRRLRALVSGTIVTPTSSARSASQRPISASEAT